MPASSGDPIYIGTNGPLTISGTVLNLGSYVDIHNNGTGAGNFTDISGNVGSVDWVHVYNSLSPANKPLTISGTVVSNSTVWIENYGASAGNTTTISGDVTSNGDSVYVTHFGLPSGKLTVSGSLNAFYDVNYTVIGDTVNTTQRIQGMSNHFGESGIVVSENTLVALGDHRANSTWSHWGNIHSKGKWSCSGCIDCTQLELHRGKTGTNREHSCAKTEKQY